MADTYRLASPRLAAEVSSTGAELRRLTTAVGDELLWDGDPAFWTGRAPLLFPIVGALRDGRYRLDGRVYEMPKHGFARRAEFRAVAASPSSVTLRLEADAATRAAYPFDFALEVTLALEDAALAVTATVENAGERPMPASFGFHPALRWPLPFGASREAHRLVFAQDEPEPIRRIDVAGLLKPEPEPTPVRGRELAPRDALFEADALIFDRPASRRAVWGAPGSPRIAVEFPDSPMLGVWTKPGAGFLCVEPWNGIADPEGFDGDLFAKPGVFVVEPGARCRIRMTLTLLDADAD